MKRFVQFLNLYGSVDQRKNIVWNMVANFLSALQTFIFLLFVTRLSGTESAGIFSFALAVAALETVALYGISDFQATDVKGKYKTGHYFWLRILISVGIFVASLFYLLIGDYSGEKICIVLLIVLVRATDSVDNVFGTMFLQRGRLECGAKISVIRMIFSYWCFAAALFITESLLWTCVVLAVYSLLSLLTEIRIIAPVLNGGGWKPNRRILELAGECFPLFISSFVLIYICNLPKYSIDYYLNEEQQGYFAILFLPVNVINLLSSFLFRPILLELSSAWQSGKYKKFRKMIKKQGIWICVVTLPVLVLGKHLGLSLLSMIYGVDLNSYWKEFLVLLLAGGLNAMTQSLTSVITAMRYARKLLQFYIFGGVVGTLSFSLAEAYGIMGASSLYVVVQAMLLTCFVVFIKKILKEKEEICYDQA